MNRRTNPGSRSFSLVEVVLALGVVAFAIVAILGMVPTGLSTSHAAQDDTRAAQIAQDIFASITSQAQATYPNAIISQNTPSFSHAVNLASGGPYVLGANNEGQLAAYSVDLPYKITVAVDGSPPVFDPNYASQVTIRVESKSHDFRDFIRIVSKY